jgi:hypothetical protein
MSTKFFTNKDDNNLIKKFEGVFKNQSVHYFDALIGYFRASGYFNLRPFLENVSEIRILVGINVDDLSKVSDDYKKKSQVLNIIKTACNINDPLSDANVDKALKKATSFGFDAAILKTAIMALQDRLLNEEA